MKNKSKTLLPISRSIVMTALAFGAAAMLIISSGLLIPIYGELVNADPREIFVTLGSAFTGPIGGIIIGMMSVRIWELGNNNIEILSLIIHITGGLWIGFAYKKLVHEKLTFPLQLLGWVGLIATYYFVFLFFGFVTWLFLLLPQGRILIFGDLPFQQAYLVLLQTAYPEVIFTTLITSIILAILPPKYRRPLW